MIGIAVALGWQTLAPIWAPPGVADDPDSHVAFRGRFVLNSDKAVLKILGASEYLVWLDGELIHDGPPRFAVGHPEYQSIPLPTQAGSHVLAVHVRNNGVTSRILSKMKPFLWCSVTEDGKSAAIDWKCARIPGYRAQAARISDILGWIDWCDTRPIWPDWRKTEFDDSQWTVPSIAEPPAGNLVEVKAAPVRLNLLPMKTVAKGQMATNFGYEADDPGTRFFLADLNPGDVPPQGVWRRYDLGRVRLGRPKVTLDVPAGTVIEIAMCEALEHGRVHPWITLSGSKSCNMDHFVARGGVQEFYPFTPKGGRFVEVHVRSPKAKFIAEQFLERTYFGEARGRFTCDDPLLNEIWQVGVETVRACSEDAMVDCPTRERGQWTGDVASVASEIVAAAFGDLRLTRRALVQAAQAARSDGLVAGVGPGDPGYLSTYAAQWTSACVRYWEVTGDRTLLEELLLAARKNIAAFEAKRVPGGVADDLGWGFVDWGYVRNEGPGDVSLSLHYLIALRAMIRWEVAVGNQPGDLKKTADDLETSLKAWVVDRIGATGDWHRVGYQRASLALLAGVVSNRQVDECFSAIKQHILSCFPNNPKAPRLSDPGLSEPRVLTPYFCHFAFAALLKHGEAEFVLNQYRTCWGWALKKDLTTWPEVFDLRWSHCHEWSGCPTWQLTHFILGIRPRFDLGEDRFEFASTPGKLKRASGSYPLASRGSVHVSWERKQNGLHIRVKSPRSIHMSVQGDWREIDKEATFTIPIEKLSTGRG